MNKILILVLVVTACAYADDATADDSNKTEGGRQKRLLFFDEGGTLVKTYSNPYMNNLAENYQGLPFYGKFLNPFFNFIRHFGNSLIAYTIPVSNAIIQSIKNDPTIQNTLVIIPKKDPVVEPNPLCAGKRTQIPAPNTCNNFLNCWDGWAFEQECPTGLLFSSQGYCDYADNVDCNNRNLAVEKPQEMPICSRDFEAFRSQTNCNEFFVCVNRQPVRFRCPADLAYSSILGVCDYADRVDCKASGSVSFITRPAFPLPLFPSASPFPEVLSPGSGTSPSAVIPPVDAALSPSIPSSPSISSSPVEPSSPPSSPVSSLLPPGSYPPASVISQIFPSQRPLPVENLEKPAEDKPIFTPACSSANVAMSRQEAVRQLQQANTHN